MRRALLPLVPLYALGVRLDNWSYRRGLRRVDRLAWPVISVGNLSTGGAGKTPFVAMLARLLRTRGVHVDILSRGYGRETRGVRRVEPDGTARVFGDEPLELARATGARVFVGRQRYEAGLLAELEAEAECGGDALCAHLLDDGMQHRRLARALEIVLLHRSDLSESLLPAGRLRESLPALRRADVVVLREEDRELLPQLLRWTRVDAEFWCVRRALHIPADVTDAVAFTAIARPEQFFSGVRAAGARLVNTMTWRDHHAYTARDVERIAQAAKLAGAQALVTTAKDAVRLDPPMRAALEAVAPLTVATLEVTLEDEDAAAETLLRTLRR